MTRVLTPQGLLDVYNTHLIADYGSHAHYRTLRLTQLYELSEMIEANSADTPFILLGDLNTGPGGEEYEILRDLLGLGDVCQDNSRELCPDAGRLSRIDHILLPSGGKLKHKARLSFNEPIPGQMPALAYSDHPAVEASLDARILSLRLRPDPQRRRAALEKVDAAIEAMTSKMHARRTARSWIPVYGFLLAMRYEHQAEQLHFIRERVARRLIELSR